MPGKEALKNSTTFFDSSIAACVWRTKTYRKTRREQLLHENAKNMPGGLVWSRGLKILHHLPILMEEWVGGGGGHFWIMG